MPNSVIAPVSGRVDGVFVRVRRLFICSSMFRATSRRVRGSRRCRRLALLDTRGGIKVGGVGGWGRSAVGGEGVRSGWVAVVGCWCGGVERDGPRVNAGGGGGFVTVYPCGRPRPEASNLNFGWADDPELVIAPVSAWAGVCLYVYGAAHLLVDVSGYFPAGSGFVPVPPARLLDTRGRDRVGGVGGWRPVSRWRCR